MCRPVAILVCSLALASPIFAGTEVPISKPVVGRGTEAEPSIASDGSGFFAAWNDVRGTFGTRISATGEVLDPDGIDLGIGEFAVPGFGVPGPSVAYAAGRYFIAAFGGIAIVDAATGRVLTHGVGPKGQVLATSNGREFFVFSFDFRSSLFHIAQRVLDGDGNVITQREIVPEAGLSVDSLESIAFNGRVFVLLYTTAGELHEAILSPRGEPIVTDVVIERSTCNCGLSTPIASISTVSGAFIAAWQKAGVTNEVRAARVGSDGTFGKSVSAGAPLQGHVHVAVTVSSALVFAARPSPLWAHTLVATSVALDDPLTTGDNHIVVDEAQVDLRRTAVASNGTTTIVLAQLSDNVSVLRVAQDGSLSAAPAPMARPVAPQRWPRIAAGRTTTLVAWEENRTGVPQIYAIILGDGEPFALAPSGTAQEFPRVAAIGDTYFVTWMEAGHARGRLVRLNAPEGEVLDFGMYTGRPDVARPDVASNGREFMVWPPAVAVSTSGTIVAWGAWGIGTVGLSLPYPGSSAIACGDGTCLVVWSSYLLGLLPSGWVSHGLVVAVRTDSRGTAIDREPIFIIDTCCGAQSVDITPDASGGFVIAWGYGGTQIVIVDGAGARHVLAGLPGVNASITSMGARFLVVRELAGDVIGTYGGGDFDIAANPLQDEREPDVAIVNGVPLMVYDRTTRGEATNGSLRVFVREVRSTPHRRAASH